MHWLAGMCLSLPYYTLITPLSHPDIWPYFQYNYGNMIFTACVIIVLACNYLLIIPILHPNHTLIWPLYTSLEIWSSPPSLCSTCFMHWHALIYLCVDFVTYIHCKSIPCKKASSPIYVCIYMMLSPSPLRIFVHHTSCSMHWHAGIYLCIWSYLH